MRRPSASAGAVLLAALIVLVLTTTSCQAQVPCAVSVQSYWEGLEHGNFTAAFQHVTPNVTLHWPGDTTLLPMAGVFSGPSGIATFFETVSRYFDFTFCPSTPGPQIFGLSSMTQVYAYWEECSPLKGTTHVPCPNNLNQAQYVCDAQSGLIANILVNLDNLCVAKAICSGTVSCTASSHP